MDMGIDSTDGSPIPLPPLSTEYSSAKFLKVKPSFFSIKPAEKKKVLLEINLDEFLDEDKLAMVLFSTANKSGNIDLSGFDIGVNVLLKSGEEWNIKILNFASYQKEKEIVIIAKVLNDSKHFLRGYDKLFIQLPDGKVVKEFKSEYHFFLPPKGKRIFKYEFDLLKKGAYHAYFLIENKEDKNKFLFKDLPFFIK